MPDAIFERIGDSFMPTAAARGPWDEGALHGGPPAMLLAREVEACPADVPMDVVRLTVELLKPVPMAPLRAFAQLERPGKRVQLVRGVITADGVEVAWARALRIRREELGVDTAGEPAPPPPESLESWSEWSGAQTYASLGVDLKPIAGALTGTGPASMWVRLKVPVVAGEEPSQLQRVAAAADFGNGISFVLDWQQHVFMNPELTIHLQRRPEGEWIAIAARTEIGPGYGLAQSSLYDTRGEIGRSLQALYVAERPPQA